ncbi:MAG TPA: NUDIX domain-containing protein [Candidatus Limnocylindrales bacterium]|nr:NUDIX domain-containing protein [Candidatus Limnocylindrales bacterium]
MQTDPRLSKIKDCLYRISVKAIIVKDNKVLLVKEQDDEWWSFPGGGVDYGEDTAEALKRELTEELGVNASEINADKQIIFITIGAIVDGVPRTNLFYHVDVPSTSIKATEHVIESGWFLPEELYALHLSPTTGDKAPLITAVTEQISKNAL